MANLGAQWPAMGATPTVAQADGPQRLRIGRAVAIVGAMFIASVGIDLLFNAGLLAEFYVNPGPALLPPRQMLARIPFGYASVVLTLGFLLWLLRRTGVDGWRPGLRFGLIFGAILGAAGGLGLFSILPLGAGLLAGVAVCQMVQYGVAGAIGGAGLAGTRAWRLYIAAIAILVGGTVAASILQNTAWAHLPRP